MAGSRSRAPVLLQVSAPVARRALGPTFFEDPCLWQRQILSTRLHADGAVSAFVYRLCRCCWTLYSHPPPTVDPVADERAGELLTRRYSFSLSDAVYMPFSKVIC